MKNKSAEALTYNSRAQRPLDKLIEISKNEKKTTLSLVT